MAHIQATFNNTAVTIADLEGNVVCWSSAGSLGFKGSRKGTPFAAQQAAVTAANRAREVGHAFARSECQGAGFRPRFRYSRPADRRPGNPCDSRRDADSAQRMPAAEETTSLRTISTIKRRLDIG